MEAGLVAGEAQPSPPAGYGRPRLIFFHSRMSGPCRRAEAHLDQVLQRRHNHETFAVTRVSVDARPDLAERFHIDSVPTILVIENRKVQKRIVKPTGPRQLGVGLEPWLR